MSRLSRAESQARTRAALLDGAAEVFVERGFSDASVEAISERAGYTRGAFYSNFASKEALFAELLQERVYRLYREMAEQAQTEAWDARRSAERLAAIQAQPDGRWMFRLWLELVAHAGRSDDMRRIASGFWSGNRALMADIIRRRYEEQGAEAPIAPERLASALIAMDIGLAMQHYVDPEAVPLDVYPDVWEAVFGRL